MFQGVFTVIDSDGYRPNVGIILINHTNLVFWARRIGQQAWQFPQGGIRTLETPEEGLYRELYEELGLEPSDVAILGCTSDWLRYRLPKHLIRYYSHPVCVGQKQKWFLLRLIGSEQKIRLNLSSSPEFDSWRWVNYWYPIKQVIAFKRDVYRKALRELAPLIKTPLLSEIKKS
ncbi:MAG: RNA pyrophosphohydrolase [Legionellaceae bacterium]